ncbi:MAG: two-component regulator propeller domain-containing protein [Balneolaceae bacterium]|nr:two-component regulator propeller domain-containing protein [Balneolaceae bacterium]
MNRYLQNILALFIIFSWCLADNYDVSSAQSNSGKPEMQFQRIYEGLNSNRVADIFQDQMGYIWVGTYSGLHRYNGLEFKIYTSTTNSKSISDNFVGEIYEDDKNRLWIGTGNGIARYNKEKDNFIRFQLPTESQTSSGEGNVVNTITQDSEGTLWVAGGGDGLYYFNKDQKKFLPLGITNQLGITAMVIDENDVIWLATAENGLARVDIETRQVEFFTPDPSDPTSIASASLTEVILDAHGNLWVGTQRSGLERVITEDENISFKHYLHEPGNPNSLGNNNIFAMYVDRLDQLWVGNENGGLHLYNETEDNFYRYNSDPNTPGSLTHNSIWTIFQDRQMRYWIGMAQSGINISDKYNSKFTHYYNNSLSRYSLNNDIIRDIWGDDEDNLWIATDGGGLNYFNKGEGTFTHYMNDPDDPNSIGSNAVISLNEDENGNLWVGTWAGGLNILSNKEAGVFTTFNEMFDVDSDNYPIQSVFDFHFGEEYIWVAAFQDGLVRYNRDTGNVQQFASIPTDTTTLSSNLIIQIYEDSFGNIWIGSLEGLSLLRSEEKDARNPVFERLYSSEEDSLSIASNSIRHIIEDSNHNIWFATNNGLSKYVTEKDHFINYYESDGLPVNEIRSIVEDDSGNIWLGTIDGISKFDPLEETFTNFDKSDGLQINEFSRYSAHKTSEGELLFGGLAGFILFHPDKIENNPYEPPVYLTNLKLSNQPVDITDPESPLQKNISLADTLVLSYRENVITFDFVALNYTRPEYNQYAYLMEGFEDEWNYVGSQRNATYTNLDPGEYIFRVKASNNDGIWNEEGTSITLFITPPFWQTTWFYLLTALFIGASIFAIYRLRVRSIRERNRQLAQLVAERTEELKEKNQDLETTLEELETTKDELIEKAHKAGMADIATGVLHNVGNVLTSVNTSASLIEETARQSKLEGLIQANLLLRKNIDNIDEFIANNPKGKNLLRYYLKLEDPLKKERQKMIRQSERLNEKIELINEIIAAQQNYASTGIHAEQVLLDEIIDNAISLQAGSIERHNLDIVKDLQASNPVFIQRSKLIHVLINILKNAKEAMAGMDPEEKKIVIKTWQEDDRVYLSISDTGPGIKNEHLGKIFTQGFTTKKNGHGFGLHSSANYLNEMGGSIKVHQNGKDKGATFTLNLPSSLVKE